MAAVLALVALAACAQTPPAAPVPALRVDVSKAGASELEDAAAVLAGASTVMLSERAFTTTPEITVEQDPGRTLEGPIDGRRRGMPVRLRLEIDGQGCLLRRIDPDRVVRLVEVRCRPVADRAG